MYVDKRLAGVLTVQTLSRLNRIFPGKEDTFVLDFVNDPEEILEAFKPYFRTARLEERTDPNLIHELKIKLDGTHVYFWNEVKRFAEAFFDPKRTQASLHPWMKPTADRYRERSGKETRKDEERRSGPFEKEPVLPLSVPDNGRPPVSARDEGRPVSALDRRKLRRTVPLRSRNTHEFRRA